MTKQAAPAIVGLLVAWGGTAILVSPLAEFVADPSSITGGVTSQVALWGLFAVVAGIVAVWEREPLASLWIRPLSWASISWACALTLVTILAIVPIIEWVRLSTGLPGYAAGMETALRYPVWLRVFAVLTAGVVEETLFRGFAVTRLLRLGSRFPLAIILSSAVFAAIHLPFWGAGPSLAFFLISLATTGFFVWRRDLLTMILAHVAVDMWALVITPRSRWWE